MSFLIYFAMLIAALVSVVMGLEVVSAPPVKTVSKPALVEPIRHAAPVPLATPSQPAAVVQQPAQPAPPAPQNEPRQTVSQSSEADTAAASEPAPVCNVQACEAAYRSFTASDCTYQPFDGPRRLCTK